LRFKASNHCRHKWPAIKGGRAYAYHWVLGVISGIGIIIRIIAIGIFPIAIFIFSHNTI
jgi:hypothetical protein